MKRWGWVASAAQVGTFVGLVLALASCSAEGSADGRAEPQTGQVGSALANTCPHDVLCTGSAMPSASKGSGCTTASGANGYCVPEVCGSRPSCCSTAWDDGCVQEMKKYTKAGGYSYDDCPAPVPSPAPVCPGPSCGECSARSSALGSSCDYCTSLVCSHDSYCCNTAWDSQCVSEVSTYCGASFCSSSCTPTTCAAQGKTCGSISNGCSGTLNCGSCPSGRTCSSSNVCVTSGPACGECSTHSGALGSSCDSCTSSVCSHDSYCCNTAWDSQCVGEVSTYCGASFCSSSCTPTTCSAQGKTCGSISDGCGGTLACGTCPSGQTCSSSNTCVAGGCGGTGAPGDLTPVTLSGSLTGGTATMSRLLFGVIGDTRPSSSASSYPSSLLTLVDGLYADMKAQQLPFTLATGDFGYVSSASAASTQYSQYMNAVSTAGYAGKFFPTLGNHECNTTTSVNCCPADGDTSCSGSSTSIFNQWVTSMLTPIGQTLPYYRINVSSSVKDASGNPTWTAKFLFLADNAWDSKQLSWFNTQIALPTTYTFVFHHVPANSASGTQPAPSPATTAINSALAAPINKGQVTLVLVGHTHMYAAPGAPTPYGNEPSYEVLIGNGGAPIQSGISSGNTYGHAVLTQRLCDGAIVVDMYGQGNAGPDAAFRFAVAPNGSKVSP